MNVAAEDVAIFYAAAFGFIMCKNKRACLQLLFDAADIGCSIPIGRQYIMIADDEVDAELSKIIAPFNKKIHFLIGMTVKKITHNDEFFCFKILYLGSKPLHVFFKNGLRYGNAVLAEMACFAKMQVGEDQCFFFFPENTAACREQETVV